MSDSEEVIIVIVRLLSVSVGQIDSILTARRRPGSRLNSRGVRRKSELENSKRDVGGKNRLEKLRKKKEEDKS